MKKQIALVTALAMLSASLYGCGSNGSDSTGGTADSEETGNTTAEESPDVAEGEDEVTLADSVEEMIAMSDAVLDDSRENTSNSDTRYERIVIAMNAAPADLLPAGTNDAGKQQLQYEIYEALAARYEHDGEELWGVIAKSWENVDDLHTVVTLYDYVHDSEGNAITASDVEFSYNLAINSGLTTGFGVVEKVEAVDDYTVEFTWSEELGVTDFANVMTECYIVSEAAYDEDSFITQPIGTGPYCLSEYTAGVSYTLTPNEDYWQNDDTVLCPLAGRNVQSIRYDVISDKSQQIIAFESGGIDTVSLAADDLGEFTDGGEYEGVYALYYNPATNNTGILPNCSENSICSDINFRLAMYYAVDANAICEALGSGQFSAPASDSFPGLYDYNKEWENIDSYYNHYDVELAREYLEKTDYNGETIVCLVDSDTDRDNCAVILQGFLSQIGIDMRIDSYEHSIAATYLDDPTMWDITMSGCGAEGSITLLWDRRYNGANFASGLTMGFADDDKLQELLHTASKTSTYSSEALDEFNQYLIDQAYFYGLYTGINMFAVNKDFGWFALNYKGVIIPGGCEYYLD